MSRGRPPRAVGSEQRSRADRRIDRDRPSSVGGEAVEGRQAVFELLRAGHREVLEVLLADEESPLLSEIGALARDRGAQVRRIGSLEIARQAATEAPQGVIARARPIATVTLAELCRLGAKDGESAPFLVVVDSVTDPGNLGALMRSALGAGATGMVLPRHRSAQITATVAKAATGAIEHLAIASVAGVPSALLELRGHGLWTVGLDAAGSTSIDDLTVATEPLALVLGSEGSGLSRLSRQRCEIIAQIPLYGPVESLNVAAAAAVACFSIARLRVSGT